MEYKLIYQLEVAPIEEELTDVVKVIHWRYILTDGEQSVDVYGALSLENPKDNFVEFNDLDDKKIKEWLHKELDFDKMELELFNQLELVKYPKTIIKELSNE